MPWYPPAVRKQLTVPRRSVPREPIRMLTPRRINLHTAVSGTKSLAWSGDTPKPSGSMGYFNTTGAGGVFSHFYVREDGTVEQMQDTAYRSACDLDGNPDTISIESWDGRRMVEWTPAQVASLAKLISWILATHPSIPAKLATSNLKGSQSWGISYHSLGSPGLAKYSRAAGGLLYTTARGKVCPGQPRIAQIPAIFRAATAAVSPSPTPTPPATSGGLTMSDINTIISKLDYQQAQLKAVAEGTYGRDAINRRNADIATIVKAATDAQSRVLIDAFGKLGIATVDMNALKNEVRRAVADALDGAVVEINARSTKEV